MKPFKHVLCILESVSSAVVANLVLLQQWRLVDGMTSDTAVGVLMYYLVAGVTPFNSVQLKGRTPPSPMQYPEDRYV
jgi:hypothetical protein